MVYIDRVREIRTTARARIGRFLYALFFLLLAGGANGIAEPVWWELAYRASLESPTDILGDPEFEREAWAPWITPVSGRVPGTELVQLSYGLGSISHDSRFHPGSAVLSLEGTVSSYEPTVFIPVEQSDQEPDSSSVEDWSETAFPPSGVELTVRNRGDGVQITVVFEDENGQWFTVGPLDIPSQRPGSQLSGLQGASVTTHQWWNPFWEESDDTRTVRLAAFRITSLDLAQQARDFFYGEWIHAWPADREEWYEEWQRNPPDPEFSDIMLDILKVGWRTAPRF